MKIPNIFDYDVWDIDKDLEESALLEKEQNRISPVEINLLDSSTDQISSNYIKDQLASVVILFVAEKNGTIYLDIGNLYKTYLTNFIYNISF